MAAASKSARIVMLAPVLVAFAFARGTKHQKREVKQSAVQHFPPFVAGFVVLAVIRMIVDMFAAGAPWWKLVLEGDRILVSLAMAMVSVSIGFHLKHSALVAAGARAVALGAVAASTMAGLNLALLLMALRGAYRPLLMSGGVAIATTFFLYHLARLAEAAERRHPRLDEAGVPRRRARTLTGSVRFAAPTGEFPTSGS
jgi:F0F1-type ATP synthase assembly protein I